MKAICHAETRPDRRGRSHDITLEIDLPFVPAIGMSLMLPGLDGYQRVNDVFWSCEEPGFVRVWFDVHAQHDADLPTLRAAVKKGWQKS